MTYRIKCARRREITRRERYADIEAWVIKTLKRVWQNMGIRWDDNNPPCFVRESPERGQGR